MTIDKRSRERAKLHAPHGWKVRRGFLDDAEGRTLMECKCGWFGWVFLEEKPTRYDRFGSDYFDRKCEPIDGLTWSLLLDTTRSSYRFVVPDTVIEGAIVSTQWLGDDMGDMFCYPPRMYGTAVKRGRHWEERARYSTEEDAMAGHWRIADEILAEERSEVCQISTAPTSN